jgi:hypothetical protein
MELRPMSLANPAKFTLFGLSALDERRAVIASLTRAAKNLTAAEVRQLRRAFFEDEGVSRDEACALFDLDRAQNAACPEWTEFFVECLTDLVVWQARPTGIVNGEQAEWLLAEADKSPTLSSFALLANVLAEAHRAPEWLIAAVRKRAETPTIRAALAQAAAQAV